MKKFFLLLAMCGVMAACGSSVESNLDKMYDACMDRDQATFETLWNDMEKMYESASAEEKKQIEADRTKWATENAAKWAIIGEGAAELNLI